MEWKAKHIKQTRQLAHKYNMLAECISQPDGLICHTLTWINFRAHASRMTSYDT